MARQVVRVRFRESAHGPESLTVRLRRVTDPLGHSSKQARVATLPTVAPISASVSDDRPENPTDCHLATFSLPQYPSRRAREPGYHSGHRDNEVWQLDTTLLTGGPNASLLDGPRRGSISVVSGRTMLARYLVIAHQTVENPALLAAVRGIAEDDDHTSFILLVPATPLEHLRMVSADVAAAAAEQAAVRARAHFKDSGISLEDVRICDPNPVLAAVQELDTNPDYEGLIVSTLPPGVSRWLKMDAVSRIERAVDIPVTHVAAPHQPNDH